MENSKAATDWDPNRSQNSRRSPAAGLAGPGKTGNGNNPREFAVADHIRIHDCATTKGIGFSGGSDLGEV